MMATPPRPTASAKQKEALEIRKLQTDILFVKLSFGAQLLNTVGIFSIGVLALIYFQKPQIEQMEVGRLATERQQVAMAIERAISTDNAVERSTKFRVLRELWPNYPAIGIAEEAQNLLDLNVKPIGAVEQCGEAIANLDRLQTGRDRLRSELAAEVAGSRIGSIAGFGPIAASLQRQLAELDVKIEDAKQIVNKGCPPQFRR